MSAPESLLRSFRHAITGLPIGNGPGLAFGIASLDAALGGGLAAGLHEISPPTAIHCGAASGLALALAVRSCGAVLWIQQDFAGLEGGGLYGPGLDLFGLSLRRLLLLRVPRALDVLWAMEEALRCRALAAVVAELSEDNAAADLTITRRLSLAAQNNCFGFLLRPRPSRQPSAAMTRFEVASAPAPPDGFSGLGRIAFALNLVKNRRGPTGRWIVQWDHHERAFSSLSVGVAAAAFDRSDRAPLRRAG
jgi:protein ImuA